MPRRGPLHQCGSEAKGAFSPFGEAAGWIASLLRSSQRREVGPPFILGKRRNVIASEAKQSIPRRLGECAVQIPPVRIHRFNESDLFGAGAAIDLLLAGDGLVHAFISFVEN